MPKGPGKGMSCEKCGGPSCTLQTIPKEERRIIVREHMCLVCKHCFWSIEYLTTKEIINELVE